MQQRKPLRQQITWFRLLSDLFYWHSASKEVVEKNKVSVFVSFACVCGRLQSTVYANWQASEGNKRPQAINDCNEEAAPAEVIYTTVVFGREKMQQK